MAALAVVAFLFACGLQSIHGAVASQRTAKYVSDDIAQTLQADDIVVSYGYYVQGLPFYLQKRIVVASFLGELEFGSEHPSGKGWFIDDDELLSLWNSNKRVFIVYEKKKEKTIENLIKNHGKLIHPKGNYYYIVNR
nr:hypothetical protein [Pectinatus brassicae]